MHLCGVDETKRFELSTEIKNILKQVHPKMVSTKHKIMYALKNKVQLIGNLGNAPEVRNTENGKNWFVFPSPPMKVIAMRMAKK